MAKKKAAAGAPAWLVTFADLMSLLVCFFVLIISFSVPDTEKLKIAAGSIRDGFTREIVVTGVVELEGDRDDPGARGAGPDLHIEQTPEGLRIQLLDQARMSMFPLGSAAMYGPTRMLLGKVAQAIESMPNKVEIAGHTDSYGFRRRDGYDNWSLSLDRADATRKVLVGSGLETGRIAGVIGKADTDHMVADDPYDARNRRISITLLREPRPAQAGSAGEPGSGQVAGTSTSSPARRNRHEMAAQEGRRSLYSIAPRF